MMLFAILGAGTASFLLAHALIASARHARFTMDWPGAVQKVHVHPTPRIGAVGIYLGLWLAQAVMPGEDAGQILRTILLCVLPALLVGLAEDVTKSTGVPARLGATLASAVLACISSGIALRSIEVPLADAMLQSTLLAVVFTAFCIAGVTNAVNIIDGFNGLASGTTVICLCGLAAIAGSAGDAQLALACIVAAAAVTGFWAVNFPWGRLFLGDGGAYLAGFALAWLAVLLPVRNADVSPWASLLVCAYPVIEALYSITRRLAARQSAGQADQRHLHSFMARVVKQRWPTLPPVLQNSSVSVIMWMFAAVPLVPAVLFPARTELLAICAAACVAVYHLMYRKVAQS